MDRIHKILRKPGSRHEVAGLAPTQVVIQVHVKTADEPDSSVVNSNDTGYHVKPKQRVLDRWLDATVRFSGSEPVFLVILVGLLGWALAGVKLHDSVHWQVLISDVQAILSYLFDSLLMRQQLNSYDEAMLASAQLCSRARSHLRMLRYLVQETDGEQLLQALEQAKTANAGSFDDELPKESWLGRFTTFTANKLGHIIAIAVYWATIIVWIAFGPTNGWSNRWQLYCNSATSALMIFVFAFLANIREQHSEYSAKCLDAAYNVDSALERQLRALTGDNAPNDYFVIPAPKVHWLQRAIFYYADVVGTLVGVALLIIVMVVWLAIGPVLKFDDNWWLLIGTYAGLVGLNDGFVLRNVQAECRDHETVQFESAAALDEKLFAAIRLTLPPQLKLPAPTLSDRISMAVGRVTASAITVLTGVLLIVGLIIGASAMHWSTTGQLLCNVPPSIIESFFMIILITGHNFANAERRVQLTNLYRRRLRLIAFVDHLGQLR